MTLAVSTSITSDISAWWGGGRENPICPHMQGKEGVKLAEGGNHCPQTLRIHACQLRELLCVGMPLCSMLIRGVSTRM